MSERVTVAEPTTDEHLLEEFEAERPGRRLTGLAGVLVSVGGALLSVYAIWVVFNPISAGPYRATFLAVTLALTFLVFGHAVSRAPSTGRSPP